MHRRSMSRRLEHLSFQSTAMPPHKRRSFQNRQNPDSPCLWRWYLVHVACKAGLPANRTAFTCLGPPQPHTDTCRVGGIRRSQHVAVTGPHSR